MPRPLPPRRGAAPGGGPLRPRPRRSWSWLVVLGAAAASASGIDSDTEAAIADDECWAPPRDDAQGAEAGGCAAAWLQVRARAPSGRSVPVPTVGAETPADIRLLLRDHGARCSATILTTVLTTRRDWQRGGHVRPSLAYFANFYRSVLSVPGGGVRAVVLHDGLPANLTDEYASPDGAISFVKADLASVSADLGVNDIRFLLFRDQIAAHPEWDVVFTTDASDVVLRHNPCQLVAQASDKIYLGSEEGGIYNNSFLRRRFQDMGGRYLEWFEKLPDSHNPILNAGLIGGTRAKMLELTSRIAEVLADPGLAARRQRREVDVNMAALNWVVFNRYAPGDVVSGYPMHTPYKKYQRMREDVYFIHK